MWGILFISFLSGMSTPLGSWIVLQYRSISKRTLALLLGLAAGIMITVILTELMPTSIQSGSHAKFIIGCLAGWGCMILLRTGIQGSRSFRDKRDKNETAIFLQMGMFIALAIALHDLPEGLAIGAGDAVEHKVGLIIAIAITLHNIPEGMSIAAPLRLAGVSGAKILWLTIGIGLITPLGTMISIWLFTLSTLWISLSLAFAAGTMAYVVARDILPEAITAGHWSTGLGILLGSTIMLGVSGLHL